MNRLKITVRLNANNVTLQRKYRQVILKIERNRNQRI